MKNLNRSVIERIKQLILSGSEDLPSWKKLFPEEYAVANSELRGGKLDNLLADNS
jgi:hypothetical protein